MNSPTVSKFQDRILQTRIEDYEDISIITIPGLAELSPEERLEIAHKARQLQTENAPVDMTPPLDEEEEYRDSCQREDKARKQLEAEGCPPCYPPGLEIHRSEHLPEDYRAIIEYWRSFPWSSGLPLCAQLRSWREFHAHQRLRRQLRPDQQSRIDRWNEFLSYQLAHYNNSESKLVGLKKELSEGSTPQDEDAIRRLIRYGERDLERHTIMLDWIRQMGREMELQAHPAADVKAVSSKRISTPKHVVSRPSLSRAAKLKQQQQPGSMADTTKTPNARQAPTTRRKKHSSRTGKQKNCDGVESSKHASLLHEQSRPSKITKTQARAHRPMSPRIPDQQITTTRYGRVSRRPDRWVPG
ncbi:hypothetical protein EJ05DRAFT_498967 [Pseudovirgaria hyperparasitica]|uniref:Uncharacterized protein n=1 Tax=Pseudovirgaria hyperparasitica TaxID=470096 RepID=A0A6A6WCI8_9PEZI|nr:uncharacterized protein EJ05DRAFT_498967 [Pseudovirgaria hyperparasitica]KAF2759764.1 hypothetical protein EJ05DRAFT_498967 [Pseudovirgaria hyperparasitica]